MGKDSSLRARLLKVYNDLMYIQGYEQTTVRQIAEECGIGRGHLYFYFAKKEQFPIDLRRDLLYKIELILNREQLLPKTARLVRFFASMLIFRYMLEKKVELYRVQAEYACHTEVMDGFAELQYDILNRAFAEAGISIDRATLEEALLSSTYAELAMIKYRCTVARRPAIDHLFLFNYFNTVLFAHLDSIRPVLAAASSQALEFFTPLAPKLLYWVYDMKEYNYAYVPFPDE